MALISVVVPVFCNAPSLPGLAQRLRGLADSVPQHNFEFIYVDDGSNDASFSILVSLAKQDKRVHVIKLTRNFGSNAAILAGMKYAVGDCVGFIAADLQDPPEALAEMITKWEEGAKVVLAARRDRHRDPWATRLWAQVFNYLFSRFVFPGISPEGVGFFLVDRQVADVLIRCEEKNAHLIGLVLWTGLQPVYVEYDRVARRDGKSRWTFGKKLKYAIDAFVAFSYLPVRFASVVGILLAGVGIAYAVVVVILRISHNTPVQGWTMLMVVLLVVSGVQLIMLGVIGEYLWRTLDAARRRPPFVVDTVFQTGQPSCRRVAETRGDNRARLVDQEETGNPVLC